MKRKTDMNIGGVDWISELPEGIIHGIMSHLSSKEVAQTCVLSKKWYHYKRNYPVLDFELPRVTTEEQSHRLIKFRRAVYDSLNHFSSNKLMLQTFSLKYVISGQLHLTSDLDSWIRLALENGVSELNLSALKPYFYYDVKPDSLYTLPRPLFSSNTLTILELTSCVLDMPVSIFSSLKRLALSDCILKGSISLKDTDCPALEEMSVLRCMGEGFKSIYIPSLLRLHTVAIRSIRYRLVDDFITVEILSLSIQSLALLHDDRRSWSDINIYSCARLKSLYLSSAKITNAELHSLLLKFPLLEELYLFNCDSLNMIKISSSQLKTLQICFDISGCCCELIEVSAPNLENFIYKSFLWRGTSFGTSIIEVADCCRSLKTLVLYGHFSIDEEFHKLISRFPLLQNIWLIGCNSLRTIKVPNLQLKRLYIVSCSGLKAVEVTSPNLCEFYCSSRKLPQFSVADAVCASGVRCKRKSINSCLLRLKEILKSFVHLVKDEYVFNQIVNVGHPFKS